MPQIPWPIPSCLYGLCGRKTTVNEFPSVVETSSLYGLCGHKATLDEFPNVVETSSP